MIRLALRIFCCASLSALVFSIYQPQLPVPPLWTTPSQSQPAPPTDHDPGFTYLPPVQPNWIIHRIPLPTTTTEIATKDNPLTTSTTEPTPLTPTTAKRPQTTSIKPPRRKKPAKKVSRKFIKFTKEQLDMNSAFVVTDSYQSEEVTEPTTTTTTTSKVDMTFDVFPPFRSPPPVPTYNFYYF